MIITDFTHDLQNSLVEAQRLFNLGQLSAAITMARRAEDSPALTLQARLLIVRCLFSQGKYRDAESVCRLILGSSPSESVGVQEVRLWHAFLQIFLAGNPFATLMECETVISQTQAQPDNLRLNAVANDLMGRAKAAASEWGLTSEASLTEARVLLARAAEVYRRLDDFDESLSAMLRMGKIYLIGTKPDRYAARAIFQDVQTQALEIGNIVRQAEAALNIAELDFEDMLALRAVEKEIIVDQTPYKSALDLYIMTEHALGQADISFSYGRNLLNAGFDGSKALNHALELYGQEEYLIGIYRILNILGACYLLQRETVDKALSCYQQAAEVAEKMHFTLGQATAYMGIGDYFYRTGNYARALAAYERSETLVALPVVKAMVNLVRSNAYTLMNLHDRAEASCSEAITTLVLSGPSDRLSLAYYILGNILVRRGNWTVAIAIWKDGLAVDEAINSRKNKAEKLQCIAQATVMQFYRPGGPSIPVTAYEEAMALYAQAITLLYEIGDQQAAATIANTYQLQGQSAIACGHYFDALKFLEQARNDYASIGLAMQTAMTDVLLGLLFHDLGGRGYPDFYAEAARCQELALKHFKMAGMLDVTWKVSFYSAHTAFRRSLLAITSDEQQMYLQSAAKLLEDAAADIETVRGNFIEANPATRESAQLGLVIDKEKVYTFAIQLQFLYLKSTESAFNWIERLKGRVFLDSLSLTPLRSPTLTDVKFIDSEKELFRILNKASTQAQVVDLNEQLHALWDKMAIDPAAVEYVALRRGEPVNWETVRKLL
jgi:tetratricopeptide (TPR) repeat protein